MEWISVKDRLPDDYDVVIVNFIGYNGSNRVISDEFVNGKFLYCESMLWTVLNWMPLPEPPKQ